MKFIDEYRDPKLFNGLLAAVRKRAGRLTRSITIMEVCGSHTNAIGRFGIRGLLPENIRLISGPGCPVCVTCRAGRRRGAVPGPSARRHICLLRRHAPGARHRNGGRWKRSGPTVRTSGSSIPRWSVWTLAQKQSRTGRSSSWGSDSRRRRRRRRRSSRPPVSCSISNLAVFSVHKVIPPAIDALLSDPLISVDGFMLPGHVSTILGTAAYSHHRPKAAGRE